MGGWLGLIGTGMVEVRWGALGDEKDGLRLAM